MNGQDCGNKKEDNVMENLMNFQRLLDNRYIVPENLPLKEVNKRIKQLRDSFIWDLMPGTKVLQVTEGVTVHCNELINETLYTSKVETIKEPVIYLGFSVIDDNDEIKENYVTGHFYNQKRLTFGEYFKHFGLIDKKYTYGFYNPKRYITKSEQYVNTKYTVTIDVGRKYYTERRIYLSQVEKDKVYFNFSLSANGPFHNAYIELIR